MTLSSTSNSHWDSLVQEHQPWIRRLIAARVGVGPEADDVTQEVLLAAGEHVAEPVSPQSIRPWLYSVTIRRIADHFRRHYAHEQKLQQYAVQRTDVSDDAPAWKWLCDAEQQANLQAAMEQLASEDQTLLRRKYRDDWSYEQLAIELDMTPRHVEYRLVKAKMQLRRLLQSSNLGVNP